ncbi:hypothetical protein ACL7DI_11775 [Bordetella pertussis]
MLGAGSWGTALAAAASRRHPTVLWARDGAQAQAMAARHENTRYLPGVALPHACRSAPTWSRRSRTWRTIPAHALIILGVPVARHGRRVHRMRRRLPARGLQACRWYGPARGSRNRTARLPMNPRAGRAGRHARCCRRRSNPARRSRARWSRRRGCPWRLTSPAARPPLRDSPSRPPCHGAGRCGIYATSHRTMVGVEVGGALKNVIAWLAAFCRTALALRAPNARARR